MARQGGIRPAVEEDAGAIAALSAALGYAADAEAIRARVLAVLGSGADLLAVAATSGDRVIGWVQAHAAHWVHTGWGVEIVGLVVDSRERRRGVGRRLVAEAEGWAASRAAETITVRSNLRRSESHAFYPALGFELNKTQAVYRKDLPGSRRGR